MTDRRDPNCGPSSPGDLHSPVLIHLKGWLLLLIALLCSAMLIGLTLDLRVASLLALCVWSSCRFYYYAFYVIERYVDGRYRFAGLWSFLRWWLGRP